ncbi:MAG TPA: class I fructose-bisphosphate aldolase [Puia sp.]|jgi:fructose-bisphosphate aldolase class I
MRSFVKRRVSYPGRAGGIDGDHSIDRSAAVASIVLRELFIQLHLQQVNLHSMILKPNMGHFGIAAGMRATTSEVVEKTVECLLAAVPAAVSGIAFLSGGQIAETATSDLNKIRRCYPQLPWPVPVSYSRAIQQPTLHRRQGNTKNVAAAQALLIRRLELLVMARTGSYLDTMEETIAAGASY